MNYLTFPGCSLRTTGRAYEESIESVFEAMGVGLKELDDWNCCGATNYMSIDETEAFALAARNLALAEQQSENTKGETAELIAPCNACYLVLSKTQRYMDEHSSIRDRVYSALDTAGLHYTGKTKVRHPIDVIVNDIGLETVKKSVKVNLAGLKVACYYGCQIVRPFGEFDHPHYPTIMEKLVTALGGEPIDWPLRTRCCGGSLIGTIPSTGLRLNRALLKDAMKRGAQVVITCCPLCQFNMECYQDEINKKFKESIDIPVAYFTQLMGVAFGLPDKKIGLQRLFKPLPKIGATKKGEAAHA
jgi:heterodisulfide reductase subunit B